jgi:hypothetical protein
VGPRSPASALNGRDAIRVKVALDDNHYLENNVNWYDKSVGIENSDTAGRTLLTLLRFDRRLLLPKILKYFPKDCDLESLVLCRHYELPALL